MAIDFKFGALGLKGRRFRLKGRAAEFIVHHDYHAAGVIPAVVGRTPDNRFQTAARVEDIDWIEEPAASPCGTEAELCEIYSDGDLL